MNMTWLWDGSDTQRRRYCRTGFILFCVLPTLLVASWILVPNRRSQWEDRLARACELPVRIGDVDTLTPRHTLLSALTLLNREQGRLATAESVRVSELRDRTVYTIERSEIHLSELNLLLEHLQSAWPRQAMGLQTPLEVIAHHVTLRQGLEEDSTALSFDRVHLVVEPAPDSLDVTAQLYPAGTLEQTPIHWTIQQHRVASVDRELNPPLRPTSITTVDSGDHRLPVSLLTSWWPALSVLGSESEFQGRVQFEQQGGPINADLMGQLTDVDLTQLVTSKFPRVLSGLATLELNEVKIRNGQLDVLTGRLSCNQGQIGQPFLRALQQELGLVAIAEDAGSIMPFRNLDVRFHLQGPTLELAASNPNGFLMMDDGGYPMLAEGSPIPLRPQDLVRALVSSSRIQVPLTRETSSILSWLPLPDSHALTPESQQPPRGILRMNGSQP